MNQVMNWNNLGKAVLSKKDMKRIKSMSNRAEMPLDDLVREVLMSSWVETRMAKNTSNPSEQWLLEASLKLMTELYSEINFNKVMDRLDYSE